MSQPEQGQAEQGEKAIDVTVTFPLAQGKPFHAKEAPTTTDGAVRTEAMAYFGIAGDAGATYYLTHQGARVADGMTLKEIAGKSGAVKFTLVKELIQG